MKRAVLFVCLASLVLLGCTGTRANRFQVLPSEERDEMRLSVIEVDCSKQKTTVRAEFAYRSKQNLDEDKLPSVSLFQASVINPAGYIYPLRESSSSQPRYDETIDRMVVSLEFTVEGDACEADRLVLELQLEFMESFMDKAVIIDLNDREIGDEWAVNKEIRTDGAGFLVESVKIITRDQLRNDVLYKYPALEFHIGLLDDGSVKLRCVYFGLAEEDTRLSTTGSMGCSLADHEMVSYTMIGEPVPQGDPIEFMAVPTEFILTEDLYLNEPWRLILEAGDE